MNLRNFLEKCNGKNIKVEIDMGVIRKVTLEEIVYNIKEDEISIIGNVNDAEAVINLNEIRNVEAIENKAIIILDDKNDTKIEITIL